MANYKKKLSDYAYNTYSQFGCDGIIEKIFKILGTSSKICVEFGAYDGFYISNTAKLWTNGWKGILIESDENKYLSLVENVKKYDCHCIKAFVGYEGLNTLENILKREKISDNIDFLSIDIEGDDYYVFESLKKIRPRLIACAYNPTIPAHIDLLPEKGNYFGCSALALAKLAEKKNYRLIAITEATCFFVRSEDFKKFKNYDTNLESIAPKRDLTYFITGYDGNYMLSNEPAFGCARPSIQKFIGKYYSFPILSKHLYYSSRARIIRVLKKASRKTYLYPLLLKIKLLFKIREKGLREIYKILKKSDVAEKAIVLAKGNKYIFKVYPRASKAEIKKAIENLYKVHVKNVEIINVYRRRKIFRSNNSIKGFKTGYKDAIVALKKGEKIEIMPH